MEEHHVPLFKRALPSPVATLVPVKWLWRWASRRFGIFPREWNAGGNEPQALSIDNCIMYGESPRFHAAKNALYFSDMYAKTVIRYDLSKRVSDVIFEHSECVSGLGWLPDGRLLVAAMDSCALLAYDEATQTTCPYADLSKVTRYRVNDMVVAHDGQVYVGNIGFDVATSASLSTTTLVRVDTMGHPHVEATDLFLPNGCVLTPDGQTLIVAETLRLQLTAFDIQADGSLANRRVWAFLGVPPDGICLDAEGCVWVAVPQVGLYHTSGALMRVREGGEIVNLYGFGRNGIKQSVFACQLVSEKGTGRHFLYFLEAKSSDERTVLRKCKNKEYRNGELKCLEVDVGPATCKMSTTYSGGYC